jgi:hypothetical protein
MIANSTIKTMVRLKIKRSTPRRVLNTEPALLPPKALPRPALRACNRMKKITAIQRMICTTLIAGSHCCNKSCPLFRIYLPDSGRLYHTLPITSRYPPGLCFSSGAHEYGILDTTRRNALDGSVRVSWRHNAEYAVAVHLHAAHTQSSYNLPAH